jgi:hypothetical protein
MKTALLIISGMLIMYVILKFLSGQPETSESTEKMKAILKLQQTKNLMQTNEFRELTKTTEFRSFVGSLVEEQIKDIADALIL